MEVIDVDFNGVAADGEDFTMRASRQKIKAGLAVNVPVLLRFPDGSAKEAMQVRITPKGVAQLKSETGNH